MARRPSDTPEPPPLDPPGKARGARGAPAPSAAKPRPSSPKAKGGTRQEGKPKGRAPRERAAPRRAEAGPRSRAALAGLGAVIGAGAAIAFAGWEAALLRWLGLLAPAGADASEVLLVYAAVGAALGAAVGAVRETGARFALALAAVGGAYLLLGKVAAVVAEAGAPPALALLLLPAALGLGVGAARTIGSEPAAHGLAAAAFVVLALALPPNLHLLPHPLSTTALLVDSLALVVGGLAAAAVVAAGSWRGPPVVGSVIAAGAIGWGAWAWLPEREARPVPVASGEAGPAVVIVVIDALRADRLAPWGGRPELAPNLARLARGAAVYETAWAAAPWTLPSMGSLLTGRAPTRHGAGVHDGEANRRSALRLDVPTLAEHLREAGYTTGMVTTNPWTSAAYGFDRGFSWFDGAVGPWAEPVGLHPLRVLGLDPLRRPAFRPAEDVVDAALRFSSAQPGRGWLLVIHLMDVHGPHDPQPEDLAALAPGSGDATVDAYEAALRRVDRSLGGLLLAIPDEAWVFVTADHGEELAEGRPVGRGVPAGTRHGHTQHEELLRVPLLVRGPGLAARRVARPVSLVDLAPTVARIAGAPPLPGATGEPLVELVGGEPTEGRILVAEAVRYGPEQQAARRGPDKLIVVHGRGEALFDLAADPVERRPLGLAEPTLLERARVLRGALPAVGAGATDHPVPVGAEVRLLLERLGYVDP